jgi:hypothetical protein
MADQWFICEEGKQTGPYSFVQLQEEVKAGRLKESGLIWAEGFTEWQPASTVENLFTPQQFTPPPPGQAPKKGGVKKAILIAGGVLLGLILLLVVAVLVTDDPDTAEPPQPDGEEIETPGPVETAAGNQAAEENNATGETNKPEENEANSASTGAATEKKTFTVEPNPQNFNQGGISFVYPGALFGVPVLEQKKGSAETEMGGPYPDYKLVSFDSFFLSSSFFSPYMLIYPAYDYRDMNDYASETIELMLTMLTDSQKITNAKELPYIPPVNAAQVFHSNVAVIEFKNGKGLRYITTYHQNYSPITNQELEYTFQGLTTDGRYFVSISFPAYHSGLPANYEVFKNSFKEDAQELKNDYQGYVAKIARKLDQSAQNEFNPPLQVLDEMIKSMEIK